MPSAETQSSELRQRFETALNNAITRGLAPTRAIGLGPYTFEAVAAVAQNHPDATAELIADAYEAFQREHRR